MITLNLPAIRRDQPTGRYIGRHHHDTVQLVDPDHRLTPAAYQTYTRTHEQVPATVDQPTGLLFPRDVTSTNQWTVTAAAGQDGGEQ